MTCFCNSQDVVQEDIVIKLWSQFLVIACLLTGTMWAAGDPVVGKWKLDVSRSRVCDLMRVAPAGANKYSLIFNAGDMEIVVPDGTDQPGMFGTTVSITVLGPNNWKVIRKQNGHMLLSGNWKLSEDGKTLTDTFTSYDAKGSMSTVNYTYLRTAGASGFEGSWENQSNSVESSFELQIQTYQGDGFSFINPSEASTKNVMFDGKDYPQEGKYLFPGTAIAGRRVDKRSLEMTEKINGRVTDTQRIEVSPDLKTLTMTIQPAGQSRPNIFVFDRE